MLKKELLGMRLLKSKALDLAVVEVSERPDMGRTAVTEFRTHPVL